MEHPGCVGRFWKRAVASVGWAVLLVAGGVVSLVWSISSPEGGLLFDASGNFFTPRMGLAVYALVPLTMAVGWLAPWGGRWWGGFVAAPYLVMFAWMVWQDGRIAVAVVGFLTMVAGLAFQWLLGFGAAWLRDFFFPTDQSPSPPASRW